MALDVSALVSKAREEFDKVEPVEQDLLIGGELVKARFYPVTGQEWRALVVAHPPRTEVEDGRTVVTPADRPFGFNADSLLPEYPRVALVDGDEEVELSTAEWAEIVSVLAEPSLEAARMTVWGVNVYQPAKAFSDAGKASAGGRKRKRRSPANSASQSGS